MPVISPRDRLYVALHAIEDETMQAQPSLAVIRSLGGRALVYASELDMELKKLRQNLRTLRSRIAVEAETFHAEDHNGDAGFPFETCPNSACVESRKLLDDTKHE